MRDVLESRSEPLAPDLRLRFEAAFQSDFAHVRIHSGRQARAANTILGSQAFAAGDHIAWGAGSPDLRSAAGEKLLKHELAHVAQQRPGGTLHGGDPTIGAGDPVTEREAQMTASAPLTDLPRLTPTRIGIARSADEFLNGSPYLADRSPSQLEEDADEISEWLDRQTTSSAETAIMQEALANVRAELARRLKNASARVLKAPRRKKRAKGGSEARQQPYEVFPSDPARMVSTDDRPLSLITSGSPSLLTGEARREEVDKIITWLQRTDVSRADRKLLQEELASIAPSYEQDREQRTAERKVRVIQKAIAMPADGDKQKLLSALSRIDGIQPLPGSPGLQYLMDGSEMIRMNDATVLDLRAKVGKALEDAAQKAMDMNNYTFGRAQDFVKVNDDQKVVGFIVSEWSGKNPYDMWDEVLPVIQRSNITARGFTERYKAGKVSISEGGAEVLRATEDAQLARKIFNETFDSAMDAADSIVNGLEIVRDVSFTVTLALGAAIAAPVIAAGVGGLGVTGVAGGGLTILGTAGTVGTGGAVLGGGSTWLAGGSTEEIKASAWKWSKRGAVTGLGAGTTQVLGTALNVGGAGLSTTSNILRTTAAQAGGNFVAGASGTALEGGSARQALTSGLLGAGTSIVAAPLGAAANSLSNPLLRTTANMGVSGIVGYGTTYILTGNTNQALLAAGTSSATTGLTSLALQPQGPTWGQRRAFAWGRAVRSLNQSPGSSEQTAPLLQAPVEDVTAKASQPTAAAGSAGATDTISDEVQSFNRNVDEAFREDAQYETGQPGGFQLRQRTTQTGKRFTSLSALALTRAQLRQAARLIGQRLAGGQLAAWSGAANPREVQDMAEVQRLWGMGSEASKQQARGLAREVFDRHVGRYWAAVRRDPALRAEYESAGLRFDLTKSGAPRYRLSAGEETGITLDHVTRLMDDPTQALSGNNLSAVLGDENSVTLEAIRNSDPFQR